MRYLLNSRTLYIACLSPVARSDSLRSEHWNTHRLHCHAHGFNAWPRPVLNGKSLQIVRPAGETHLQAGPQPADIFGDNNNNSCIYKAPKSDVSLSRAEQWYCESDTQSEFKNTLKYTKNILNDNFEERQN